MNNVIDIVEPLIEFLNRIKNKLDESQKVELEGFISQLKSQIQSKKIDVGKVIKTISSIIQWAGVTDQVLKDIIHICTHPK